MGKTLAAQNGTFLVAVINIRLVLSLQLNTIFNGSEEVILPQNPGGLRP